MNLMLLGAVSMACLIISVFFIRFWRSTHDRFFLFFSVSFFIEGSVRVVLGLTEFSDEQEPLIYLLRLVAFILIIFAIIDKNRAKTGIH